MRHLFTLYEITKDARYQKFILKNAESIVKNKDLEKNYFGVLWDAPFVEKPYAFVAHSSALDALVAAVGAQKISPKK